MARQTKAAKGARSWEFPKASGIRISEVVNSHGGATYGASYIVSVPSKITGGERSRKQFKTLELAEAHADACHLGFQRQGNGFFELTASERREVAVCLPRLREHGISLTDAVNFAVERISSAGKDKTAVEVVAELVASKQARLDRGDLRVRSAQDFKQRAEKFAAAFAGVTLSAITAPHLKEWLTSQGNGPRSNKNYINVIGEVFKHAKQRRFVAFSPLDEFTTVDRKELCGNSGEAVEPSILTPDQAEALLRTARENPELGLLPVVALGLFCGLRTEEIKRLDWASIRLGDEVPTATIGAKIAKKRRIRHVEISSNGVLWLSVCPQKEGPIVPQASPWEFQERFRKLTRLAGFGSVDKKGKWNSTWENNAMRHSFGSYHYALHGNPLDTARLMGHKASDAVLFEHYRALTTKEQAHRYFSLRPQADTGKVVRFA